MNRYITKTLLSNQNKMCFLSKYTNNEITKRHLQKEHSKSTEPQSYKSTLEILTQTAFPTHPSHNFNQFKHENMEAKLGTETVKVREPRSIKI